jgi:hypothetical protein
VLDPNGGFLEDAWLGSLSRLPVICSRRRSAWPLWRAYSSIMWQMTHRTLAVSTSGGGRRRTTLSPSDRSTSASAAPERAPNSDGSGHWLVASDGAIFTFGDARFRWSLGAKNLSFPTAGMITRGSGYTLIAEEGYPLSLAVGRRLTSVTSKTGERLGPRDSRRAPTSRTYEQSQATAGESDGKVERAKTVCASQCHLDCGARHGCRPFSGEAIGSHTSVSRRAKWQPSPAFLRVI